VGWEVVWKGLGFRLNWLGIVFIVGLCIYFFLHMRYSVTDCVFTWANRYPESIVWEQCHVISVCIVEPFSRITILIFNAVSSTGQKFLYAQ
jgi:hypothetical protein